MLDFGTTTPKNHAHLSDLIKLSSDDSYGGGHGPVNTRSHIFGNSGLACAADEEEGSGASTPPLWGSESPDSRRRNYAALSPRSRTEAITRGQMELMEMVKNMPEACYELSLKDLVEANHNIGRERLPERQGQVGSYVRHAGALAERQHRHHQMVRSGSLDGNSDGFLLKMVFPVPWRARKKKNRKIGGFNQNSENSGVSRHVVPEKEWWKTRASLSTSARGDSTESGGESSTLNSGSRKSSNSSSSNSWSSCSNNSSRRHESDTDCWSFIRARAKASR